MSLASQVRELTEALAAMRAAYAELAIQNQQISRRLQRLEEAVGDDWERIESSTRSADAESEPVRRGGVARNRYYVVIEAAPGSQRGIYNRFLAYGQAVKEPGVHWSGRGNIPFFEGSASQAFPTIAEAEAFWEIKLPGVPVKRHF